MEYVYLTELVNITVDVN